MSESRKNLIFCVHAHQPVGNFDHVFSSAYERCYKPFFETLESHLGMRAVSHFSGSLLDWLEVERPEFLDLVRRLVGRGQLEILGGAYYEPIYAAIPARDLAGQIALMRSKLRSLFGLDAEGVWLTERVWEPGLTSQLHDAGVRYTVLDDTHFERAGAPLPTEGYSRSGQSARNVDLFAASKGLRYAVPFRRPEEVVRGIESSAFGAQRTLVFADDCEKFGMWPGTHAWVYGRRWLDRFFSLLEKSERISVETFSSVRRSVPAGSEVDLPSASYGEMMEWSDGNFANFFEKYPESGYMKDRMSELSERLQRYSDEGHEPVALETARKALYRSQCNCPYWHGVFGGLYLHHLRSAVFENLIEAERRIGKNGCVASYGSSRVGPLRFESGERWIVNQPAIRSFFNPSCGAALEELDSWPRAVNLICSLRRSPESYHGLVTGKGRSGSIHGLLGVKEKDLPKKLFYDRSRRLSFMDRFFTAPISAQSFADADYEDIGDLATGEYEAKVSGESLVFGRRGRLSLPGGDRSIRVEKRATPEGPSALKVEYSLTNQEDRPIEAVLGVEFNFSIGAQKELFRTASREASELSLKDEWRGIGLRLTSDVPGEFLTVPVETVSGSEGGLERTYQGVALLWQRRFGLRSGETARFCFGLEVEA